MAEFTLPKNSKIKRGNHFKSPEGATNVRTTALEFMRGGAGVCQDFAHLTVAALRRLGT